MNQAASRPFEAHGQGKRTDLTSASNEANLENPTSQGLNGETGNVTFDQFLTNGISAAICKSITRFMRRSNWKNIAICFPVSAVRKC